MRISMSMRVVHLKKQLIRELRQAKPKRGQRPATTAKKRAICGHGQHP